MKEVFPENLNILSGNISANTRSHSTFYNPSNPKKVNSGLETLRSLDPKIWDMIPIEIKSNPSLDVFKCNIKKWIPRKCPCRLCKVFVPQLGFL